MVHLQHVPREQPTLWQRLDAQLAAGVERAADAAAHTGWSQGSRGHGPGPSVVGNHGSGLRGDDRMLQGLGAADGRRDGQRLAAGGGVVRVQVQALLRADLGHNAVVDGRLQGVSAGQREKDNAHIKQAKKEKENNSPCAIH